MLLYQAEAVFRLLFVITGDERLDAVVGVKQAAEAAVVVQAGHDVGDILAHIRLNEPGPLLEFRRAVGQVGGDDAADGSLFVGAVESLQPVGEEREGSGGEDAVGLALLSSLARSRMLSPEERMSSETNIILAFHIVAQVFMGDDGIASVHHGGIVAPLVEQTHVDAHAPSCRRCCGRSLPSSGLTIIR